MNKIREKLGRPRKWSRIKDVPTDVKVTDITGDLWKYDNGWSVHAFGGVTWLSAERNPILYSIPGPFKEVK